MQGFFLISEELFSQKVLYSMELAGKSGGFIYCKEAAFFLGSSCLCKKNK